MSMVGMLWAFKQDVTPTEKLVLLALGDHADHRGVCWPGLEGIATKTGLNRDTVSRAIRSMESKGVIEIERPKDDLGRYTGNRYFLKIDQGTPTQDRMEGDPKPYGSESKESLRDQEQPTKESISSDFEKFYSEYPRHEARADALKAWKALKPDPELIVRIIADLSRFRTTERQFVPLPATYLRGRRWEDGPPLPKPEARYQGSQSRVHDYPLEEITPEQRTANLKILRNIIGTIGK